MNSNLKIFFHEKGIHALFFSMMMPAGRQGIWNL